MSKTTRKEVINMKFSPVKTRSLLGAKNKPQRWLAEATGLHVNTVSKMLSGDESLTNVTVATVNLIANALSCNPVDLMDIDKEPPPHDDAPAGVAFRSELVPA